MKPETLRPASLAGAPCSAPVDPMGNYTEDVFEHQERLIARLSESLGLCASSLAEFVKLVDHVNAVGEHTKADGPLMTRARSALRASEPNK